MKCDMCNAEINAEFRKDSKELPYVLCDKCAVKVFKGIEKEIKTTVETSDMIIQRNK